VSPLTCRSGSQSEQPLNLDVKSSVVVLPVDPYRVYVYWTIEPSAFQGHDPASAAGVLGAEPVLRFHSIPPASFDMEESGEFFDVKVDLDAPNWYVQPPKPLGRTLVELGLKEADGRFTVLARSGLVQLPPASPSENEDEVLMLVMGDYHLPHHFPDRREEQPVNDRSTLPAPAAPSPGKGAGFHSAPHEEALAPPSLKSQSVIPGSEEATGLARTEPDPTIGAAESRMTVERDHVESSERSFASGLSSILFGADR